jgi:hypothetical protein
VPVELQSTLWIACDAADQALEDVGEDDINAWIARYPLAEDVRIERPERVDAAVARLVSLIGETAEQLLPYATVDAFVEELASDPDTSESGPTRR